MCLPVMKERFCEWIVEIHEYIASNPQFIVNGFVHTGITKALDGNLDSDREDDVSSYSTLSTSDDSEPASDPENVFETETVVAEGDSEVVVIEDIEPIVIEDSTC